MRRPRQLVEVTDLVRRWDSDGSRHPVRVDEVVASLRAAGDERAVRLVRGMPARDGMLDDAACDALILRVHAELQRFGEEVRLGRRIAEQLRVLRARIGLTGRMRVVDIGCGLGHVLRSIAADGGAEDLELVGCDLDRTLVEAAGRLALAEGLDCRFVHGDALHPGVAIEDPARTIVISSGLLHHLDREALSGFIGAQAALGVAAFSHWDPVPGPWSTGAARVFHAARMREAVSRHDGVVSVRRAHRAVDLLAVARPAAPSYDVECGDPPRWMPPLRDVLRPLLGVRR